MEKPAIVWAALIMVLADTAPAQVAPANMPASRQVPQPSGGPWNNDLMLRWSTDGTNFGPEKVLVERAGVPSLAVTTSSVVVAAFQWFPNNRPQAFDHVSVMFSESGALSWTDPVPIEVSDLPGIYQRPFDPTIVALPSGGFRVYFSSGPKPARPAPSHDNENIGTYSAVSADGIHYQFEAGPRFAVPGRRVIDPAVAHDGRQWYFLAPIGKPEDGAFAGVSTDGLTFTRTADIPSQRDQNWTGNLLLLNGRLRFYGSAPTGVWWSELAPDGNWTAATSTGAIGGDPGVAYVQGKVLMVSVSRPRRQETREQSGAPALASPKPPVHGPTRIQPSNEMKP